ncbi:uncharacterized protein BT62DRAFT_1077608, partial [Guyanagaster necrorhizus]
MALSPAPDREYSFVPDRMSTSYLLFAKLLIGTASTAPWQQWIGPLGMYISLTVYPIYGITILLQIVEIVVSDQSLGLRCLPPDDIEHQLWAFHYLQL